LLDLLPDDERQRIRGPLEVMVEPLSDSLGVAPVEEDPGIRAIRKLRLIFRP
jgi:hypothetical protein